MIWTPPPLCPDAAFPPEARRATCTLTSCPWSNPNTSTTSGALIETDLSVFLPACLPFSLSACLPVWLSVFLSACLSVCLPAYFSVCLSACLLPGCLSFCLPIFLSFCLPACLSICLPASYSQVTSAQSFFHIFHQTRFSQEERKRRRLFDLCRVSLTANIPEC